MPRTLFWFTIPIGVDWHHELPIARDENGHPVDDWTGWSAAMKVCDQDGNLVLELDDTNTSFEMGKILLEPGGLITLTAGPPATSGLTPTTTYAGGKTRARLFGDLMLVKDRSPALPLVLLAARMTGVATTTTATTGA